LSLPSFFLPMEIPDSTDNSIFDFDLGIFPVSGRAWLTRMTSLKIEIKQLLNITFPELEHM